MTRRQKNSPINNPEAAMERNEAFTLLEVMVALAIGLLLAVLAYSSYANYIVKARRVEAQVALLQSMQDQERYYTHHNTYLAFSAASDDEDAKRFPWWLGSSAPRSAYELSGRACDKLPLQACIELRAEPGTPRVDVNFRDADCETLTLDSTGKQGAGGKQRGCWP
jgi:type IV pilus assembly protein PilE